MNKKIVGLMVLIMAAMFAALVIPSIEVSQGKNMAFIMAWMNGATGGIIFGFLSKSQKIDDKESETSDEAPSS